MQMYISVADNFGMHELDSTCSLVQVFFTF